LIHKRVARGMPRASGRVVMLNPIATSLERYMDLLSARQKLVASNIANADTPGFKAKDIDFEREFRSMIEGGAPQVVEVTGLETKHDGNNVSLDREARLLAENALRFNVAASLMRAEIRATRSAIEEGRNG
jgi:flagellar basal-body rod protein FlgB